jgi:hypothetical protein
MAVPEASYLQQLSEVLLKNGIGDDLLWCLKNAPPKHTTFMLNALEHLYINK